MGLYMFCLLYSRSNELDGFVPKEAAEMGWSRDLRANRKSLSRLCTTRVGYLRKVDDGYQILKYEEFNETKAEVAARRSKTRKRQTDFRDRLSRVTPPLVTDSDSDSDSVSVSEDPELGSGSPREAYLAKASGSDAEQSDGQSLPAGDDAAKVRTSSGADGPKSPALSRPPDAFGATFLTQAYVDGQADAGVEDFPTPSGPAEIRALDEMARRAHAKGREPHGWIRVESKAYRVAQSSAAQFQCGFSVAKCLQWIGNGRPVATAAPHLRAVPDTPPAPYHAVNRGYSRDGDEIDTGAAAGGVLAALGGGG